MTEPDTVSADYTLRPSELATTLALLVKTRQPVVLWGAPGYAKSALASRPQPRVCAAMSTCARCSFAVEGEGVLLSQNLGDGLQHRQPARRPDPSVKRALFWGTVGEAAVEFSAFLKVWRELPHPQAVLDDPDNAVMPDNASVLIALYRMANDITLAPIVTYAGCLRREVDIVPPQPQNLVPLATDEQQPHRRDR